MKSYSKYKPSGVDWLGEIPEHWCIWKMTRICEKIGDGLHGTPEYEEGSGIFFVNGNNLSNGKIEINENTKEIESKNFNLIKKEISLGSVLYSINGTIGNIAIYNGENILLGKSAAFFVCRNKIINLYLFHYLTSNSVLIHLNSTTEGTTIKNVSLDTLRNLKIPLPSLEEQQSIINFLDYKTGQCDRFIANRQKQIELLNEQKAAIINKSVTKGINTNAKMKPSGIEWIGDIPEHWKVSKVKFIANVKGRIGFRGYTITDLVDEGQGALTLGATHIDKNGEINLTKPVFISWDKYYESPEIMVEQGDILVVQRGSIGVVGIVNLDIGYATINPSLTILKKVNMNRYLLFLQLRSKIVKEHINVNFNETAVPMLSQNQILNFNILLLPTEEQQSIVDFITKETSKIETLISKYQKQIDLMQEYRTALISQAVTGKIDVRDWQPH